MRIALVLVLLVVVVVVGAGFVMSKSPSVRLEPAVKSIGVETPVKVVVESPHGVKEVHAVLEQNGKRYDVYHSSEPSKRWSLFGRKDEGRRELTIPVGKKEAPDLQEGPARLLVDVTANDFAAKSASTASDVQVTLSPPTVSADGFQHYVNQGGMELVTFNVGGSWNDAGVRVGKYTFRSWPMPGSSNQNQRFSMFAFPWDVAPDVVPVVYARNAAGTEATARFWLKVFPKQFRSRDQNLDDRLLTKVANELDPGGTGTLVERFIRVNSELRKKNNQELADLRFKTEPKILWHGPFYRLGKVESFFADQRTYFYNGKKVDQQMHLGFDLSDVQASPVKAANSGRVVHAGPLGIYGNCIVLDHGYALQSIYGHMRQIDVKPGDMVQKEQVMGKSGDTGLAGGDHVHFSMQIDGVQINPIEWWDEHWIKDRILSKLPPQS